MIEVSPELLAFLRDEENRARNEELLDRAEAALNSYNGEYYGDEVDGASKVVSRDVAEVVDHMNVSVLRTFVSGDRVVEFEPDSPESEQAADDATEVIQRQFQLKGYGLLHDWLKEGNIATLGIVKACVERRRKRAEFITPEPEADGVLGADPLGADPETGIELFKAVRLEETPAEFRDYLVPLEEFRISPDARDPDDAVYVAHASPKTLSELAEMGFDDLDDLDGDHFVPESLSQSRDVGETMGIDREGANRRVLLLEEYVRFDADGDGISERLCVHRVGDTILRIEPCDYQPFVIYCPFPMPGRIAGHSLADKVTDIQRINTALMRLYLDTQYLTIAPRMWVPEECVSDTTYDDLLSVIPGQLVRGKGQMQPVPLHQATDGSSALQAIEFMIGQRESRTGITRLNQGLDADALNKTATGTALMQAQGQQIEEYLARNFAEAVARLMRLKLKLMARYAQPSQLRVEGEYRQIDPSQWPEDMNVVIRVGLGSGKKEQRLAYRQMVLELQSMAMQNGLSIVTEEQLFKSMQGIIKDANLGSATDFVIDPATLVDPATGQAPPKPPSPEEQKMQAEVQLKQAELQGKQQEMAAKLQLQQAEAEFKLNLERERAAAAIQLEREKAQAEMQMNQQRLGMEMQLEERKMAMQERMSERDALRRDNESAIKANRSGGSLAK